MSTAQTTTDVLQKPTVVRCNIEQQCPIQYVTVYNDRAEVTRRLQHRFDAQGTYDVVFEGFSTFVDLPSLHVSGGTGKACTILEVSYESRSETSNEQVDFTKIEQLQNELARNEEETAKHQRELVRVDKQRAWIEGRAGKLMDQDVGSDLSSMEQFLNFYHQTLTKLDNEKTSEENAMKILTTKKSSLQEQIDQHGAKDPANPWKQTRQVTVTVHIAEETVDVALEIAYLISNCSWTASYDVRVNSVDGPQPKTQLTYYGIIVNKSQENWSDVQLSLSTAAPSLGGALPKLATLRINFETAHFLHAVQQCSKSSRRGFHSLASASACKRSAMPMLNERRGLSADDYSDNAESEFEKQINVLSTQTEASMSSTSFTIPRRSTIEADGKPHKVTIGVLDLTSTFTYTVVPKLSLHAYLKASTTNTSDKQLLAGPASVFMDNNFITHSSIANVCLGDHFDLPLGVDASVKVEYKPVKKLAETYGLLSKVHHETTRHEILLTNMKSTEVLVNIYDQLPLSSDETIKVKLIQPDFRLKEQSPNCTASLNDENNLEWKCLLRAREQCRLPFEYTTEWPKDKRVEFKQA